MDRVAAQRVAWQGLRSCVCIRPIHTYTLIPGVRYKDERTSWRQIPKACCRCPEDCLCHGGGEGNWGAVVEIDP